MRRFLKTVPLLAALALSLAIGGATGQSINPVFGTVTATTLFQAPASSNAGAGLNVPQGTAPTTPNNGDLWTTASGLFARIAGATVGPFATVSTPCTTCVTSSAGGALAGTAPIVVSGSSVSLGLQPFTAGLNWDSTATVPVYAYQVFNPWTYANAGTIASVSAFTGGSSTPSFTFSLQINGTNVPGCSGIVVNSATLTTTTCNTGQTITNGQKLTINITATTGTPSAAWVQVAGLKPAS